MLFFKLGLRCCASVGEGSHCQFWPNNSIRMYVVEGATHFLQALLLDSGDTSMGANFFWGFEGPQNKKENRARVEETLSSNHSGNFLTPKRCKDHYFNDTTHSLNFVDEDVPSAKDHGAFKMLLEVFSEYLNVVVHNPLRERIYKQWQIMLKFKDHGLNGNWTMLIKVTSEPRRGEPFKLQMSLSLLWVEQSSICLTELSQFVGPLIWTTF
ncbi:hypothetical protein ACFE04_019345 [Oxalis oulophora]